MNEDLPMRINWLLYFALLPFGNSFAADLLNLERIKQDQYIKETYPSSSDSDTLLNEDFDDNIPLLKNLSNDMEKGDQKLPSSWIISHFPDDITQLIIEKLPLRDLNQMSLGCNRIYQMAHAVRLKGFIYNYS